MKRKHTLVFAFTAAAAAMLLPVFGCGKSVDYTKYISEKRTEVYIYEDDTVSVNVRCSEKEQPFSADGYLGDVSPLCEIFVTLPKTPDELEVSVEGHGGEMNYQAVDKRFELSFSAEAFKKDGVDVTLTYGGESKTYTALNVKHAGVMSCEQAVNCVVEHDKALFEGLTKNNLFDGEIFVRLLYDEACYYYVGVCDKTKHITAYLIDGESGKILATKSLQG